MDHQQQPQQQTYNDNFQNEKKPAIISNAYDQRTGLGNSWTFKLFDCFSPVTTCCFTCWCPCVTFGKIYARTHYNETEPSGINSMCAAHCALLYCGLAPALQWMNRVQTREKYGFPEDKVMDLVGAFCCGCCQLVQEEKESVLRQTGVDLTTNAPYAPPANMTYP